jgi:drug/metabolite transporter (DMT)-like permease
MLVLGDVITGWQWAGTALVVSSLAITILGPRMRAAWAR